MLGLESARTVFERYRTIRARERDLVDWPDPQLDEYDMGATSSVQLAVSS